MGVSVGLQLQLQGERFAAGQAGKLLVSITAVGGHVRLELRLQLELLPA